MSDMVKTELTSAQFPTAHEYSTSHPGRFLHVWTTFGLLMELQPITSVLSGYIQLKVLTRWQVTLRVCIPCPQVCEH